MSIVTDKDNIIDASPTKPFFISMITRDLRISRAILDLIDNSVDAAYLSNKNPEDIKIKIYCSTEHFIITDNCGGMKLEDAQNYAFKFGRDVYRPTPHSVGQFGVGMKRTLFKLGSNFLVESFNDTQFSINVDVPEWLKNKDWHFTFQNHTTNVSEGETYIKSYNLLEESVDAFSNPVFLKELKDEIEKAHFKALNKGIKIYLNDNKLETYQLQLKFSDSIKPVKHTYTQNDVDITITAGIADRDLHKGGWYIICNGRLIEEAEQTSKTGWGNGLPSYHPDYAFFRGIVEFTAEDSYKLPWTTTKTGVDADHIIFRFALNEMRKIIKPIISSLKGRVKEADYIRSGQLKKGNIEESIKTAEYISYENIPLNEKFVIPTPSKVINTTISISYKVSKDDFLKVQSSLGENLSNKDIGLKTFDYYLENECD